jgi:hypothetical protein
VLTEEIEEHPCLVAGVPAKVVRPLNDTDRARARRKTRCGMLGDYYDRSQRSAILTVVKIARVGGVGSR